MSEDIAIVSLPSRYGPITAPATDMIIERSIATCGEWAQLEIDALAHFIKDGDTVLDVGACFGARSLAFSDLGGPSRRVIGFEASDKLRRAQPQLPQYQGRADRADASDRRDGRRRAFCLQGR